MDLYIVVEDRGEVREVRLEGRLAGPNIAELLRVVEDRQATCRFDLSQLLSLDEVGVKALQELRKAGGEMVGARPLIEHFLNRDREQTVND